MFYVYVQGVYTWWSNIHMVQQCESKKGLTAFKLFNNTIFTINLQNYPWNWRLKNGWPYISSIISRNCIRTLDFCFSLDFYILIIWDIALPHFQFFLFFFFPFSFFILSSRLTCKKKLPSITTHTHKKRIRQAFECTQEIHVCVDRTRSRPNPSRCI